MSSTQLGKFMIQFFVRIDAIAFEEFDKNHTYSLTQMTANLKL